MLLPEERRTVDREHGSLRADAECNNASAKCDPHPIAIWESDIRLQPGSGHSGGHGQTVVERWRARTPLLSRATSSPRTRLATSAYVAHHDACRDHRQHSDRPAGRHRPRGQPRQQCLNTGRSESESHRSLSSRDERLRGSGLTHREKGSVAIGCVWPRGSAACAGRQGSGGGVMPSVGRAGSIV